MSTAVTLRRASAADCETILQMQRESFAAMLERYQDYGLNPACETAEQVAARLAQPETYYYYIDADGETVGAIRIVDAGNGCRISPLFILPAYRGRGYAQAAIRAAERLHPTPDWTLTTILQEKGCCHLYEKMGYRRTGVPQTVNDRMTLVHYEKHEKV